MEDGVGDGDDGGGYGVELLNASRFNNGVDRARNADNEDKSSLLCARIFELNFVPLAPPPPLPPPTGLLTAVAVFVLVLPVVVMADVASTTCAVAVSVLISSVAAGSNSNSVFSSRVATVADDAAFCCNDGNSIFKLFGRSNFLCLYTAGRSVDSDESVDDDDDDDEDDDIDTDVVVIGVGGGGACIIFFGVLKLLKRFMPDTGAAGGGDGVMLDFLAFNNALKCSG